MVRRPVPLRLKVALAGLAGVGLAWLIPRGNGGPTPSPSLSATNRPGLTAAQIPLDQIDEGVSFRLIDGVRVFLSRSGTAVVAFHGRSTATEDGPVWWCGKTSSFQDATGEIRYDRAGHLLAGEAPRELERIRVVIAGDSVTVFPHDVTAGPPATPGASAERLPAPCSASERIG